MDGFEVTADQVKAELKAGVQPFFINVRKIEDWDVTVLKARGSLRVPDDEIERHLDEIPQGRTIVIYSTCPGDGRSVRVARYLSQKGWNDVHPLKGGFSAYLRAGLPVEEIGEGSMARRNMYL